MTLSQLAGPLLRMAACMYPFPVSMFQIFRSACSAYHRGLEQSVALPRDSYLQHYYDDVFTSLR